MRKPSRIILKLPKGCERSMYLVRCCIQYIVYYILHVYICTATFSLRPVTQQQATGDFLFYNAVSKCGSTTLKQKMENLSERNHFSWHIRDVRPGNPTNPRNLRHPPLEEQVCTSIRKKHELICLQLARIR